MEAAGLASSIIAILDLTAKIIARSHEYISKTQNAPEYLRAISVQLPLLARSLETVKRQALSQRIVAPDIYTELLTIVNNASDELRKLNLYVSRLTTDSQSSKLTKINRAVTSVLRYDSKIEETLTKLKGYTDTLNFFQISVATGKTEDILGYLRLLKHGQIDLQLQYRRDTIRKWLAGKPRADYIDACIARKAPGTCNWIFDIPAYSAWLSSAPNITDPHILWIHGPPGVGKTFISAAIFARIEQTENAAAVFWTSEGAFANASLIDIPRSWIAQLLTKNLAICDYMQHIWSNSKSDTASTVEVWSALKDIISSLGMVTLIVDGLDEYQHQQARRAAHAVAGTQIALQHISINEFLATLKATLRGVPCRILCVSQPDSEIKSEMEASRIILEGFPHCYEHAITKSNSQSDLDAFARHVIDNKLPKKSEQFRTDLSTMVASKAEGQMLWIALQEREANHLRPSFSENKLRQVIEGAPRGLDQLYEVNLNRINQLGINDRKRAWRILNWIMYGLRSLTVHEIVEAILIEDNDDFEEFPDDELPDDPDEVDVYGELRALCGNFIAFDLNGKDKQPQYWQVRFAHSSVRVFLTQHLEQSESGGNISALTQGTLLARLCIRYLMYDNVWPKVAADVPQRLNMETHPLLTYAASYFILHINSDNQQKVEPLVRSFLVSHYNNYSQWHEFAWNTKDPGSVGLATFKNAWRWKNRLTLAAALGLAKVVELICDTDSVQRNQKMLEDSLTLQAACWSDSPSTVQVLLDRGFQINRASEEGFTPLHIAAARDNVSVVELLISNGADLNTNLNWGTPLHRAALWGRDSAVRSLLDHSADPMLLDPDGSLPLHNAAKKGHKSIARSLLGAGPVAASAINRTNDDGWSPLLLAVGLGDRELVEILLQHGGNPIQLGHHGQTPLLLAAEKGKEEVFDLILDACVDMSAVINNFNTQTGSSLLHLAVQGRNLNIVKKLIQEGADADKRDYNYRTPLDMAIQSGYVDMVDFLFNRQTNLDSGLRSARPLHYACDQGNKDLVDMLIKKGADLKACTSDDWTPLACAVDGGHTEVVELILKNDDGRSTVNLKNLQGFSPLLMACGSAYVQIIKLLLENGADSLATSEPGCGPISHATSSGKTEAVQTLLDKCGSKLPELFALHNAAYSGSQDVFDLVKKYYPINDATFLNGATLLHCAAYGGNVEIINDILNSGDPEKLLRATSKDDETVLSWATRKEHVEAAKVILKRCGQLSPPLPFDDVALYSAILNYNLEVVKLLYETDPESFMKGRAPEIPEEARPPLHQACYYGAADIMRFLIEKGFKVSDCDARNRSCLHEYAQKGHENVAQFFRHIDWKVGLAVVDEDGLTPLLQAAYSSQSRVFRRFLREGASILDRVQTEMPATRVDTGDTLLHAAAYGGDSGIADLIIETCGKDCLNWRNQVGELPIHTAACYYQHLFLEYLCEQGATVDVLTFQKETPLFFAVVEGSELATTFLLSKGAASFEKQLGSPVVAYAALHEYPFVLNSLLDHGFELDYGQKDGVTLLHLAASFDSPEIVPFLLGKGLDWESKDSHGWTVRDCLETSRFKDSPSFEKEMIDGPRSWLKCSAWAFSEVESSWFIRDGEETIAKIRESNIVPGGPAKYPMWTITADHYLLPTPAASYFEVTISKCPPTSSIGVGLAILIGEYNRCEYSSALYYGESGWLRDLDEGGSCKYAYPYGEGDTIGCGIDYKAGNLFFTKNGECLGCTSDQCYQRYTPAVFSMERSLTIEGNFGQKPFLFDIAKHGWDNEKKCETCYDEKGELIVRAGDEPYWDEDGEDEEDGGDGEEGEDVEEESGASPEKESQDMSEEGGKGKAA